MINRISANQKIIANFQNTADLRLPTPLEKIPSGIFFKNQYVYIKRDDLAHPFLTGNKWRKLSSFIPIIREKKVNIILSMGGSESNHLLSLTYLAEKLNIKAHLFIRDGYQAHERRGNAYLLNRMNYCRTTVARSDYRNAERIMEDTANRYRSKGMMPLVIPEGGTHKNYGDSFEFFFDEFASMKFDILLTPVGSGGTLFHLTRINQKRKTFKRVIGYPVVKMSKKNWEKEFNSKGFSPCELVINDAEKPFAKISDETLVFSRNFMFETGIPIDPYYSGKALHYLYQNPDKFFGNICFYHTGGFWGIFTRKNIWPI